MCITLVNTAVDSVFPLSDAFHVAPSGYILSAAFLNGDKI